MLDGIKSKYILQQIFRCMESYKYLHLIRYNKKIQNFLDLTIKDFELAYKDFNKIIIEIIADQEFQSISRSKHTKWGNCSKEDAQYVHTYFNDEKEEFLKTKIVPEEISKIKLIIDSGLKTFKGFFESIFLLKEINIIRFKRNDITDISRMFYMCVNLTTI